MTRSATYALWQANHEPIVIEMWFSPAGFIAVLPPKGRVPVQA